MRLQNQLMLAFTSMLLVVMAVTGYVIYSLILDLLIKDEQRQLEQKGEILVNVLEETYGTRQGIDQFNDFLREQDLQLFLYDKKQNAVLLSTMSNQVVTGFFVNNDFSDTTEELWEYGNDKFVTSRILFYPESLGLELILLTPLTDLQIVQQNFIQRMLIVLFVGVFVAVMLSYFLTRKLVTPLSHLKLQLKKVEKRKFDEIESVQATGEIKEVAESVYEMANELQRYINTQQTFFQNASHELKTPLMTIQGYAEGIKEQIFDDEEEEKGLEVMVSEVNRLKKIINEMILLAKLESEQSVYKPQLIKGNYLISQVIDRVLPVINERGLTLNHHTDANVQLYVDEEKMLRALLNLSFNAIRHAESTIDIVVVKGKSHVVITIKDDGEGIDEDLIPHIFQRFVKGKTGETGLGLAIARAIIEQSGGRIEVGNTEQGGAEFTIIFPEKTSENNLRDK